MFKIFQAVIFSLNCLFSPDYQLSMKDSHQVCVKDSCVKYKCIKCTLLKQIEENFHTANIELETDIVCSILLDEIPFIKKNIY